MIKEFINAQVARAIPAVFEVFAEWFVGLETYTGVRAPFILRNVNKESAEAAWDKCQQYFAWLQTCAEWEPEEFGGEKQFPSGVLKVSFKCI